MFSVLKNLHVVRSILYLASNRAWWWESYFAPEFVKIVRQVKFDKSSEFKKLIDSSYFFDKNLMHWLSKGYLFPIEHICYSALDFSNFGRGVASLAFLSFIIDLWSKDSKFTADFMLDSVSIQLWQRMSSLSTAKRQQL